MIEKFTQDDWRIWILDRETVQRKVARIHEKYSEIIQKYRINYLHALLMALIRILLFNFAGTQVLIRWAVFK